MWQKILGRSFLAITKFRLKQSTILIVLLHLVYSNKFHFFKILYLTNKYFRNDSSYICCQPIFGLGTSPNKKEIKLYYKIAIKISLFLAIYLSQSFIKITDSSVAEKRLLLKIDYLRLLNLT